MKKVFWRYFKLINQPAIEGFNCFGSHTYVIDLDGCSYEASLLLPGLYYKIK